MRATRIAPRLSLVPRITWRGNDEATLQAEEIMAQSVTIGSLWRENALYAGTAGVSGGNRAFGFAPGFLDTATGDVYASCGADGRVACVHLLDGLPEHVIESRNAAGRVARIKGSIVSGFLRAGRFYTRAEAAALVEAPCLAG